MNIFLWCVFVYMSTHIHGDIHSNAHTHTHTHTHKHTHAQSGDKFDILRQLNVCAVGATVGIVAVAGWDALRRKPRSSLGSSTRPRQSQPMSSGICISVLQCVLQSLAPDALRYLHPCNAVCCSVMRYVAEPPNPMPSGIYINVLQCVAVRCSAAHPMPSGIYVSVLQLQSLSSNALRYLHPCVAVCCSVAVSCSASQPVPSGI